MDFYSFYQLIQITSKFILLQWNPGQIHIGLTHCVLVASYDMVNIGSVNNSVKNAFENVVCKMAAICPGLGIIFRLGEKSGSRLQII